MKIEGKQNKWYAPAKFHCEIKKKIEFCLRSKQWFREKLKQHLWLGYPAPERLPGCPARRRLRVGTGPYRDLDLSPAPGQVFQISLSFQHLLNKAHSPYPGPFGHPPQETPLIISTGQKREEMGEATTNFSGMLLCQEHPASPESPGAQQCQPGTTIKNGHFKNALKCFCHGKRSLGAARCCVTCFPAQNTFSIHGEWENDIPHEQHPWG